MTRTRQLLLVAVVGLAVALAGCGTMTSVLGDDDGGPDVNVSNYDAETLAQDAQAAMESVDSYTFEMDMEMAAQSQMGEASIEMSGDGRANIANERLYMDMHMDVSTPMQSASEDVEAYQVGDTMYTKIRGTWQTQPAEQSTWSQTGPGQQSAYLEDAEVSIEGAETVNGEDTLVVSVEPTDEALEAVAATSADSQDVSASRMEIESATVTQYIAAEEPHYVMRTELAMTAVVDGTEMELSMDISMDDHGEEVTVDVPDEIG